MDRVFEGINFILNPESFSDSVNLEYTFEYKLIYGEAPMPKHAKGAQGIQSRFSSPEFVNKSAKYLSQLDVDYLASRFDPGKMEKLELYKCGSDEEFIRFKKYIIELTEFYSRAALRGYGLLCIRD